MLSRVGMLRRTNNLYIHFFLNNYRRNLMKLSVFHCFNCQIDLTNLIIPRFGNQNNWQQTADSISTEKFRAGDVLMKCLPSSPPRNRMHANWANLLAMSRGVSSAEFLMLKSAPISINHCRHLRWPLPAALWAGVDPLSSLSFNRTTPCSISIFRCSRSPFRAATWAGKARFSAHSGWSLSNSK